MGSAVRSLSEFVLGAAAAAAAATSCESRSSVTEQRHPWRPLTARVCLCPAAAARAAGSCGRSEWLTSARCVCLSVSRSPVQSSRVASRRVGSLVAVCPSPPRSATGRGHSLDRALEARRDKSPEHTTRHTDRQTHLQPDRQTDGEWTAAADNSLAGAHALGQPLGPILAHPGPQGAVSQTGCQLVGRRASHTDTHRHTN